MRMFYFKLLIVSICFSIAFAGYLTPEHVEEHIKRLIAQKYQLYVINLGTTVNNNPLKAYVISGLKRQQAQISQLTHYPATLITSYMHPRQPYSIKLMQKILDEVLNNYETDYYLKYMLDNTLLILFPFVNIDGYYRYKQLEAAKASQQNLDKYRKNMNKYGTCQNQWEYGVDINRNFNSSFGTLKTSEDECGQEYRGPAPFSQKESKAINMLFKKFHITLAIDIHSYGNQWIYPYASEKTSQKLQNHNLYPIYQDLKLKFESIKRPMKSCYESLGYQADGVYIDWALDQGALSLAVEIGTNFNNDNSIAAEILFQVEEPFHIVLRKNSISYKKFLSADGMFIVQSTSLIDFYVEVLPLENSVPQTKLLQAGKYVAFPLQQNLKKIILRIKDTIIKEEILLEKLDIIDIQTGAKVSKEAKGFKIMLVLLVLLGLGLFAIRSYLKKQQQLSKQSFRLPQYLDTSHDLEAQTIHIQRED